MVTIFSPNLVLLDKEYDLLLPAISVEATDVFHHVSLYTFIQLNCVQRFYWKTTGTLRQLGLDCGKNKDIQFFGYMF